MYTLDTNVPIYYMKGDREAYPKVEKIFSKKNPIYLSTMSEIELFAWSNLTKFESDQIETILQILTIIPIDSHVARIAASIRREYGLKIPDSTIAATAMLTGSILVTRNLKDFQKIPDFPVLKI